MKVTLTGSLVDCHCGSTHMGRECPPGFTFADRLRSAQLHPDATPSREKRRYWDQQALDAQFGPDAKEHVMEATQGRGLNDPVTRRELETELFE